MCKCVHVCTYVCVHVCVERERLNNDVVSPSIALLFTEAGSLVDWELTNSF